MLDLRFRGPGLFWHDHHSRIQLDDQGLKILGYRYSGEYYASEPPFVVLGPQFEPGATWLTTNFHCQITATAIGREYVTTPAGSYDALRVRYVSAENCLGSSPDFELWLAERVGIVRVADIPSPQSRRFQPHEAMRTRELLSVETMQPRRTESGTSIHQDELRFIAQQTGPARVGEPWPISLWASNASAHGINLLPSLDASWRGARLPAIAVEIVGPSGPVQLPQFSICGNINPLVEEDFVTLAPGEATDLVGHGTFGHPMLRWPPQRAAVYRLRFTYDLGNPQQWSERLEPPELQRLAQTLPSGSWTSEWLEIVVDPPLPRAANADAGVDSGRLNP